MWGPSLRRRGNIAWYIEKGHEAKALLWGRTHEEQPKRLIEASGWMLFFPWDYRAQNTQPWYSGLIFGDIQGTLESLLSEGRWIALMFGKLVAASSTTVNGVTCP